MSVGVCVIVVAEDVHGWMMEGCRVQKNSLVLLLFFQLIVVCIVLLVKVLYRYLWDHR